MSTIVKADAEGAVLLPAKFCREAGVVPGADLVAEIQNGHIVLQPAAAPFWERIAAMTANIPEEEFARLPPYDAANVDEYLYGRHARE